jgi:hypothetical protein
VKWWLLADRKLGLLFLAAGPPHSPVTHTGVARNLLVGHTCGNAVRIVLGNVGFRCIDLCGFFGGGDAVARWSIRPQFEHDFAQDLDLVSDLDLVLACGPKLRNPARNVERYGAVIMDGGASPGCRKNRPQSSYCPSRGMVCPERRAGSLSCRSAVNTTVAASLSDVFNAFWTCWIASRSGIHCGSLGAMMATCAPVGARMVAAGKRGAVSARVGWPAYPRRLKIYAPRHSSTTASEPLLDPRAIAAAILPATVAAAAFTGSLAKCA